MSITDELVSHVMETRFEDIPRDVVDIARDIVIDNIGCAVGGAKKRVEVEAKGLANF